MSVASLQEFFCFHRKYLIYNLVGRNLKMRYRKSLFGMLWTILIPAGSAAVYYFVFSYILKVNVEHHLLFIICGLIPWTFFSNSVIVGTESLVSHAALLKKVPMPPQSPAFSDTVTGFINLLFSFPVILFMMIISGADFTWALIQVPILLIILFLITYPLSLMLGVIFVYFRDVRHLMTLALQLWFYLTPIMYTTEMIPEKFRIALYLNPISLVFAGISQSIAQGQWLTSLEWGVIFAWTGTVFFLSKFLFEHSRSSIVEML